MTRWKKAGIIRNQYRRFERNWYREHYYALIRESARFREEAARAYAMHQDYLNLPHSADMKFNEREARQYAMQINAAGDWWRTYRRAIRDARRCIRDAAQIRKFDHKPYFDTTGF